MVFSNASIFFNQKIRIFGIFLKQMIWNFELKDKKLNHKNIII
jgi:hypothetical protein